MLSFLKREKSLPAHVFGTPDFEAYYDDQWLQVDKYFEIHRSRFVQTFDFVRRQLDLAPARVLDVGGVGPISACLEKFCGWATQDTKSDLRSSLSIPSDSFDLILCTETIEHIKDVESDKIRDLEAFNYSGINSMLNELKRALKPSGVLIVTTPNANSFITLHKWLAGEVLLMDPQHVREFSVDELKRVARNCGLRVIEMITTDSWLDFGGQVTNLRDRLESFPDLNQVGRGDNIVAAFGR